MPKPPYIELSREIRIPILYEDRSILAIDKPAGWMLVPLSWQNTSWNLQAALMSSIMAGHFWARSRNIKYLKYIHRLDAETTGIMLFAKSAGALHAFEEMFETRRMEKIYLAVVDREPKEKEWTCQLSLAPDPQNIGRIVVDPEGKPTETAFRVLASSHGRHLIEARPYTGRTHQIRVHLAQADCPIIGDELYGEDADNMALRAVGLAFRDPFTRKPVGIRAPVEEFLKPYGISGANYRLRFESLPPPVPRPQPGVDQKGQKMSRGRGAK